MKITFCLPSMSTKPVGGFKIVFEYANRLVKKGHDVNIVFFTHNNFNKISNNLTVKHFLGKLFNPFRPDWFELDSRVKKIPIAHLEERYFPDADIVFATAVETVEIVEKLSQRCGKKFYLIQDYENWNVPEGYLISTYKNNFVKITISQWLYDIVSQYSEKVRLISNPIDLNDFYLEIPIEERSPLQLAALYHEKPHKGVRYLIEAVNEVKKKYPELSLNLFGTYDLPDDLKQDWITYIKKANVDQIRSLMNQSSIFVCASVKEGFGLTGAESMACGCALVSTEYEGVKDYVQNNVNALLSPVRDSDKLAQNITSLIEDDLLRVKLADEGNRSIKQLSWDENLKKFEEILESEL